MSTTRNYRRLGQKQLAFIDDLFNNGLTEPQALKKTQIPRWLFREWLAKPVFLAELEARLAEAARRSAIVHARSLPWAVDRLTQLTASEKDETARKACLAIATLELPSYLPSLPSISSIRGLRFPSLPRIPDPPDSPLESADSPDTQSVQNPEIPNPLSDNNL